MSHSLHAEMFFDLSQVSFADLFTGTENVWDAIRKLDDYIAAQFETGKIKSNYGTEGNVFIGEGTVIEEHVQIKGPAIFGKNCLIRHAAYFRGGCLIGDNVHIGHGSEIKHSVILNNAAIAHLNIVLDTILGNEVNFSGGAVTANYRFDKQLVHIKMSESKIETGLLKFGAVVGDGSNVGVNTVLNPGTLLGKHTIIFPQKLVTGYHPAESVIK